MVQPVMTRLYTGRVSDHDKEIAMSRASMTLSRVIHVGLLYTNRCQQYEETRL